MSADIITSQAMKTYTNKELLRLLKKKTKDRGVASQWARELGITRQYLSDILLGRRDITEALAKKLDEGIQHSEGWVEIPLHLRKRKNWTFSELMKNVKYDD